jgi:ComF family protein
MIESVVATISPNRIQHYKKPAPAVQSPPPGPPAPPVRRRRGWARWLDLLLPAPCAGCGAGLRGAPNPWFCERCWGALPTFSGPVCDRCGVPFAAPESVFAGLAFMCGTCMTKAPPFELARALGPYDGVLAVAVKMLKYGGQTGLAPVLVDRLDSQALQAHPPEVWDVDGVVPVPLHVRRLRARGYNQAARLARALARRIDRPLVEDVLARVVPTAPQVGQNHAARARNVRDAFRVERPDRVAGRTLLLVDDVITTGATARACARALRRAGADRVYVWTVARQGPERPA